MRAAYFLLLPSLVSGQALETLHRQAATAFDGLKGAPGVEQAAQAPRPSSLSLSELARLLGSDPQAVDDLLDAVVKKAGPLAAALDTPARRAELKRALASADPAVLDRFPTLSPAALAEAGELYASRQGAVAPPDASGELVLALTGAPKDPPRDAFLKPLGRGLLYGDETLFGAGAAWGDSKAVAAALEQLVHGGVLLDGRARHASVSSWLAALIAEGHALDVSDRRMHANFGDLYFEAGGARRGVATPTLLDTGLVLPSGRRLVVPVPHSELNVSIRGPRVNAELSWFFGLDGRAAFRAQETADQDWVGGRSARSWSGQDAAALLERAGRVARELEAKAAGLPAGGYGPLGDCNDAQAFVTGAAPLGMLRDPARFSGGGWLDALSQALPYDRKGGIDPERVWESRAFEDVSKIPLPETRAVMLELKAFLGR